MSLVSGIQYSKEIVGKRNVIINGDMAVNQRGFTTLAVADWTSVFSGDRMRYYNDRGTGAATVTRSTDVPTIEEAGVSFAASAKVDITTILATPTASNEALLFHWMEGYDYNRIRGGDATFSSWVKSNKTGIYTVSFRNDGADRDYVTEITIDAADTWEKKIVAIPLTETGGTWDYTNGRGLRIIIGLMSDSGLQTSSLNQWLISSNHSYTSNQTNLFDNTANYFNTTGWQFEKGNEATEFERRSYSEELAMCQRYYYESNGGFSGFANGTTVAEFVIPYQVPMRATPTVAHTGNTLTMDSRTGTVAQATVAVTTLTINSTSAKFRQATTGLTTGEYQMVQPTSVPLFTFDAEI